MITAKPRRSVVKFILKRSDMLLGNYKALTPAEKLSLYVYFLHQAEALFQRASVVYMRRWGRENYVNTINKIVKDMPETPLPQDVLVTLLGASATLATLSYMVNVTTSAVDHECIVAAIDAIKTCRELKCD